MRHETTTASDSSRSCRFNYGLVSKRRFPPSLATGLRTRARGKWGALRSLAERSGHSFGHVLATVLRACDRVASPDATDSGGADGGPRPRRVKAGGSTGRVSCRERGERNALDAFSEPVAPITGIDH